MAMTLESIRDWHREQARAKDVCGELRFPGPNESPFYRYPSEESKQHDAMADAIDAHLTQPAQTVDVGAGSAHRDEDPVKLARVVCESIVKHQFQDEHRHGRLTVDVEAFLHELNAARDAGLTRALSAEKAGHLGKVECCDAEGMWLVLADHCPLVPGQKVTILPASPTPDKEGRAMKDDSPEHHTHMLMGRMVLNNVIVPPAPENPMNAELREAVERIKRSLHANYMPSAGVFVDVSTVEQALRDQGAELARLREECNSQQRVAIQEQILAEKAEALLRECLHYLDPPQLHDRITAHLGGENNG